ncbi:hypothetical protein [Carnobacterium jeotgali]|uniref:hypothetical protein n=1 Tax=Carnobacterium jeotgali TaxID=545534 RepID=UPI000ABE1EA8
MENKKIILQFTMLTFGIAYFVSGILIFLEQFGYTIYNWVNSLQQFAMNIPFAIYILSPAVASYVIAGLILYFGIHLALSDYSKIVLPFYAFFLYLPGNLIIGGLEEAGWMYILQPGLNKKYGYILSSLLVGIIWLIWHIPLFFIPGTNHSEGLINFWMFAVQILAFRFFLWSNL